MITNAKLRAIAERASQDLVAFITESEDALLKEWDVVVDEAQAADKKAKLKFSFSATVNIDDDKLTTALSFGARRKLSRDGSIPDADQIKLPLDEQPTEQADS